MLLVCIIVSAALAAVLLGLLGVKRDIRQLSRTLEMIVKTDTNAQLTTNTYDKDIAALAENINQMLRRNRRDLMEKDHAEADLKRALTNIAHDLRTPLTAALGYLQMLEDAGLDAQTRTRYAETVRGRLDALSVLMDSLFMFTRVIEGHSAFDLQKVNIGNALRDALSASYAELAAKGFTVDANIPDAPVFCLCDADALRRVLQNLMKNVCTHGHTYLRVSLDDSGTLEIANRAHGLETLDTTRIFARFYTADASRTSQNTGLGLAIAKELVTRMGGQISAEVDGDRLVMRVKMGV